MCRVSHQIGRPLLRERSAQTATHIQAHIHFSMDERNPKLGDKISEKLSKMCYWLPLPRLGLSFSILLSNHAIITFPFCIVTQVIYYALWNFSTSSWSVCWALLLREYSQYAGKYRLSYAAGILGCCCGSIIIFSYRRTKVPSVRILFLCWALINYNVVQFVFCIIQYQNDSESIYLFIYFRQLRRNGNDKIFYHIADTTSKM